MGRPITGDSSSKNDTFRYPEQYDEKRFLDELDAVFAADAGLTAIQWSQYTPYFNDGEPCEFSASEDEAPFVYGGVPEFYVSYPDDEDEDELGNVTFKSSHEILPEGNYGRREDGSWGYIIAPGAEVSELYKAYSVFHDNLSGGHFDMVVRQNFGEHARVIATREGFAVEFYDHE